MTVPIPTSDDPAGFLRWLGAEICEGLIAMSNPDASEAELIAAIEHVHAFAGELWLWTQDIRNSRN
jgi:hypothetical protein